MAKWLVGCVPFDLSDDASLIKTLSREAETLGLDRAIVDDLATVVREMARPRPAMGPPTRLAVRPVQRGGVPGLEVLAADPRGLGVAELLGVPAGETRSRINLAYRYCDEMDFDVRLGEATCISVRKYARPIAPLEIAILGRPSAGEAMSGDDALCLKDESSLLLGVADGFGSGAAARPFAEKALGAVAQVAACSLPEILRNCEKALRKTKGAVISFASLSLDERRLSWAGVGNVSSRVYIADDELDRGHTFQNLPGMLGHTPLDHPPEESLPFAPGSVLLMFTDGISNRFDVCDMPQLKDKPPLVVAHSLMQSFAHSFDDALVMVMRWSESKS